MVARPPIANVCRVELLYTGVDEVGGHEAANLFYAALPTGVHTTVELGTVATGVVAAWISTLAEFVTPLWSLTSVTATMVDGTELQSTVVSGSPGTHGTSQTLPPNAAACISWHIDAAYRGGHPRNYLPGIPTDALLTVGSNLLLPSYAAALASAANVFLTDVNSIVDGPGSPIMGTVSYVRGGAPRVSPVFEGYLEGAARVNTRLATQRRRLGKLSAGSYQT